jgi:hypothetical protein
VILNDRILELVRPVVLPWLRRLADRLVDLKGQVRLAVIEAVSRTAAEAAEVALRSAFGVARRYDPGEPEWPPDEFDDDPAGEYVTAERRVVAARAAEPARPRWPWRVIALAALQGLSWWVRRRVPQPLATAAVALIGAALVLLD